MALQPCAECGAQISGEAAACPQCGAPPKTNRQINKTLKRLTKVMAFVIGVPVVLIVAIIVIAIVSPAPKTPAKTPEQMAEEVLSKNRGAFTFAALKAIHNSLREPDSVKWVEIMSNADGSVICASYRAKNGFGGLSLEHTTLIRGEVFTGGERWNENCLGRMYDMDYVQTRL